MENGRVSRCALLAAFLRANLRAFAGLYVFEPTGGEAFFYPNNPWWRTFLIFWVPNGVWSKLKRVSQRFKYAKKVG